MADYLSLPEKGSASLEAAQRFHEQEDLEAAEKLYLAFLAEHPLHPTAMHLLGVLKHQRGNFQGAADDLERVVSLNPRSPLAHLNLGHSLWRLGRREDALRHYQLSHRFDPMNPEALFHLAYVLQAIQRTEAALECWQRFLALQPEHPQALLNCGSALVDLQRPAEALIKFDLALTLSPEWPDLLMNRGIALNNLKRPEEALIDFEKALALKPDWADLHMNHAAAIHSLGRHREAIACYDRALACDPTHATSHSCKIGLLDLLPEVGFLEQQQERRSYFQRHAQGLAELGATFPNDRNPSRRLILGYVSSDFKHHSAALCFLPIFRNHCRSDFQINLYSGTRKEDDWTLEFQRYADLWRHTNALSDEALAAQIREDRVDILIDLSGHTAGNRLLVFARKPAPIQVTAWGHGGGTGLPTIDYLFSDPITIPDAFRPMFAEKVCDLPCCITFEAPVFGPAVRPLPAQLTGSITFGCLNSYGKVTPDVERVWALMLKAAPGSRLLLKDARFDSPAGRKQVLEAFACHGIQQRQLVLRGSTSHKDHLAAYGDLDIALDPFPLNGGISTWEALWMGVPVVTKLGNAPGSRSSGAILHALGLDDWIAQDEAAYQEIAVRMAADLKDLAAFRACIRHRIETSAAGNPKLYTKALEAAYRTMWHQWLKD